MHRMALKFPTKMLPHQRQHQRQRNKSLLRCNNLPLSSLMNTTKKSSGSMRSSLRWLSRISRIKWWLSRGKKSRPMVKKSWAMLASFYKGPSTRVTWISWSTFNAWSRLNSVASIRCQRTVKWSETSSICQWGRSRTQAKSTASLAQSTDSTRTIQLSAFSSTHSQARGAIRASATLLLGALISCRVASRGTCRLTWAQSSRQSPTSSQRSLSLWRTG